MKDKPPTKHPHKCRTPEARAKLLDYTVHAVRESLTVVARKNQYMTVTPVGPVAFELRQSSSAVFVEVTAESVSKVFVVKIWVNARETRLERLPQAVRAALDDDVEEEDGNPDD